MTRIFARSGRWRWRRPDAWHAAALAAACMIAILAALSCVDTATSTCADGLRCPPDKLCVTGDDGASRCEAADLVASCADKLDEEPCKYGPGGVTHLCRAGVCTLMKCGNGHLDWGEVCDDGNDVDGDGCSSDCQRLCGDGIVQDDEVCDTALPVMGKFCMDLGFDMGALTCAPSCLDVSTSSCSGFDWQPMARLPADWHLLRTWVFSPENAVAIGVVGSLPPFPEIDPCLDCGRIFRYDGDRWQVSEESYPLLLGLWASGPEDIHAVGILGNVWHFDGTAWSRTSVGIAHHLIGMWGTGPDQVFAVGMHLQPSLRPDLDDARFTVLRYDGRTWAPMDLTQVPALPGSALFGVWASAQDRVFAVGSRGTILHYDGNAQGTWQQVDDVPAIPEQLLAIWGTDADDMVAVGSGGTILRYDGSNWSSMEAPTSQYLVGVWADEHGRFYATGTNGTLLHHDPLDGPRWTDLASGTSSDLLHVHGSRADNVLAVGADGTVLRKGATGWTAMDLQGNQGSVEGMWGSGPDCVYAVTSDGQIWHHDGNEQWRWQPMLADTGSPLLGVHGLDCGQDVYAVGWHGTILRYAGGEWTRMASPSSSSLHEVWVGGPDAVFAVGEDGTILHYDGNPEGRWTRMQSGVDATITGIWGASAGNVFAVGTQGTILHYDGNPEGRWTIEDSKTSWMLKDVWGAGPDAVFAVGEAGHILRYDGEVWTRMRGAESVGSLRSVWGSGAGDVFAGSDSGRLFHYDGVQWAPMRSPSDHRLMSFWGGSEGEHLLLGDERGRIFRLRRWGR